MVHRTDLIADLQARLFKMNSDGWITYGQVERAAGVYRNWCNNFVSGRPARMTMSDEDINKVNAILKRIHADIGAIA